MLSSGFIFGFLTVGAYTYQTMKVFSGEPSHTLASSLVVSGLYWISINNIVDQNSLWYFGFTAGAAVATTWLSILEKRKINLSEDEQS